VQGQLCYSVVGLGLDGQRDHLGEHDFQRHAVAAALVGKEELAITAKNAVIVGHMVIIVIAMEGQVKIIEAEALPVFGVSLGLLTFSYQSIVHSVSPFERR
jgi:hypothetical protein